jgi:hypothetical protein
VSARRRRAPQPPTERDLERERAREQVLEVAGEGPPESWPSAGAMANALGWPVADVLAIRRSVAFRYFHARGVAAWESFRDADERNATAALAADELVETIERLARGV